MMKNRTKQITSALPPASSPSAYPSISSAYWLPTSNPTPYIVPGLCVIIIIFVFFYYLFIIIYLLFLIQT